MLSEKRAAFARSARRGTAPTTDGMHFHRSRTVAMLWHVMHLIVGCFQLLHLRPPSWVSGPHMTVMWSDHRPRTRARDGRTLDAHLMRRQQIIMTFGARVQIMSTIRSACPMVRETRDDGDECP